MFEFNTSYVMRTEFDWTAFEIYLRAERGLSDVSAQKAIELLATFEKSDYDKPLTEVNLSALQKGLYTASERYSPNSINLVKNTLRHWIRFVRDVDDLSDVTKESTFLDRLKRILGRSSEYDSVFAQRIERMLKSTTSTPRQMDGREERLEIIDIVELIKASRSAKWKALLAFSWDTAFRPGEIVSINYEDIFHRGAEWSVRVKREKSGDYQQHDIMTWLSHMWFIPYYENHPTKTGPLFPTRTGERMTVHALGQNISDRGRRSDKKLYAYTIRKSAATWWERTGLLPTSSIRARLGHTQQSRTFEKHYLALFHEDYTEDVVRAQGRFVPGRQEYHQRYCISCDSINPPEDDPSISLLGKSPDTCIRCDKPLINLE
ncbi:site-specific integrase [Candidatus Thorarchaeota archaeon]|nr:MAG: site-specific integrase [Candidatus Thorarchaeota archaeon]